MYDLIIGKQTLHNLGVVLDFKEKTIQIDKIVLAMRNIASLQQKSSITGCLGKKIVLIRSQQVPAVLLSV